MTTEEEKERISNAVIVYVVAPSGCGKSFMGDALSYLHDFEHVDGDHPLKHAALSAKNKQLTYGVLKSFYMYVFDQGIDGPEEVWAPYYEEIAALTIEAAKRSDRVVLSHATYRQAYRACVINKLLEGGAKRENIKVLQLTIDFDVRLKGLYYRTMKQCESASITLGDAMRAAYDWDGEGDITCDEYMTMMKMKNPEYKRTDVMNDIPADGYGTVIDVSSRDITCVNLVEEALGLDVKNRNEDSNSLSFEELTNKIKEYDQARDKEMGSNGSGAIVLKFWEELKSKSSTPDKAVAAAAAATAAAADDDDGEQEKKKKLMEKRRSTITSIEMLSCELGRTSLVDSTNNDANVRRMKQRRSSLINTGKI